MSNTTIVGYAVYFKPDTLTTSNLSQYYIYGENATVGKVHPSVNIVEIDGIGYPTLADAAAAVKTGQTMKIIKNADLGTTDAVLSNKAVILDLNGKTACYSGSGSAITLEDTASLIVTDNKGKNGKLQAMDSGNAINNTGNGTVMVTNGMVSSEAGNAISSNSTGDIIVSSGTVSATTGYAISKSGGDYK